MKTLEASIAVRGSKHAVCEQAKLVKSAVARALQAVKEARPLSLQSGFEQRMSCLADIARSAQPQLLIW